MEMVNPSNVEDDSCQEERMNSTTPVRIDNEEDIYNESFCVFDTEPPPHCPLRSIGTTTKTAPTYRIQSSTSTSSMSSKVVIEFDPVCCIGNSSISRRFNKALKPPIQPLRKASLHMNTTSHHLHNNNNNNYRFDLSCSSFLSGCSFEGDNNHHQLSFYESTGMQNSKWATFNEYDGNESQTTYDSQYSEVIRRITTTHTAMSTINTCLRDNISSTSQQRISTPPIPPRRRSTLKHNRSWHSTTSNNQNSSSFGCFIFSELDLQDTTVTSTGSYDP